MRGRAHDQQAQASDQRTSVEDGRLAAQRSGVGNAAVQRHLTDQGSAGTLVALGLQGVVGNDTMRRAAGRDTPPAPVQRDGPQLRMPQFGARPADSPYQLHLDPQIEAEIRAIEAMRQLMAPQRIAAGLTQLQLPGLPPIPPPGPAQPPAFTPPASASAPPPPALPIALRPGTFGDIWHAVQADPALGPAIQDLQDRAISQARQDWAGLSAGNRVAVVSGAITVGGAAIAGVLSSSAARDWFATQLSGKVLPVPMVPGLGMQFNLGGDNVIVGVHLDVGRLLPAALGFGPGDATALGAPPNPYQPIPAQRAVDTAAAPDPREDFAQRLASSSAAGAPLAPDVRGFLEDRVNADLGSVRLHTDPAAAAMARDVSATAFTTGQHVYFSSGAYRPDTAGGQELLVHEAVHTVQQSTGPVDGTRHGPISVSDPSDRFEREASAVAASAVRPGPAVGGPSGHAPSGGIARALDPAAGPLSVQRDGPPGSVGGAVDAAVGGSTVGHSLSASATIAGGQVLSSTGGKTIHTRGDTTVRVSVTTTGLSVDFGPALIITKEDAVGWIDVDIDLHRLHWNFTNRTLRAEWTAANAVNWWGGVGGELLGAFQGALNELPARCQAAGYNPFTDPDLPADLQALIRRLSSGGGGSLPRMTGAQVEAGMSFGAELTRDVGHGVNLVVPAGTRVTATATLAGAVPSNAADLRIAQLGLSAGAGITLNLQALGQNWPVVRVSSVTMRAGGAISAQYAIVHEDIGTALLQLLAAATAQESPLAAGQIREDLTVRDRAAHQMIDQMVRDNVEPALRDAVRANRNAVPGVDLAQALGM